jgi:hypothetical protein
MPFSDTLKEKVKKRAHYKCCLNPLHWATDVHHIKPEAEGGPNTEDNAAPLCGYCHKRYGGNPDLRKFIRQMRDHWYEQCETPSTMDPELIREMHERVTGQVATKDDVHAVQHMVGQLTETLQHIIAQPVSSGVQLRRVSDATAAFSFATLQAANNICLVANAVASTCGLPLDELTNEEYASVTSLRLSGSELSDLAHLKGLTSLQEVALSDTKVSDLAPLTGLTGLRRLVLDNTPVTELAPIKGLANLQELNISETQVTDLAPLTALTNLQGLDLDSTPVSDLTPLKGLANLQRLDLYQTQVSDLTPLTGLTNLQRLDLASTPVSDIDPLKGLANLQTLSLLDTQVSDIDPLKGLTNLQRVDLRRTQVSDDQITALKKAVPDLLIYLW